MLAVLLLLELWKRRWALKPPDDLKAHLSENERACAGLGEKSRVECINLPLSKSSEARTKKKNTRRRIGQQLKEVV